MKCKRSILLAMIFLAINSCQKDITIQFPSQHQPNLFIEGLLSPGELPRIFVSTSNPFFSPSVSPQQVFARGATVTIGSGNETDVLVPDSTYNMFRCRWEPFYRGSKPAAWGRTYRLEVVYGGKTFTASTTIGQQAPTIESIEYTPEFFDSYGGHDGVIITITDHPGTADFYRFRMDRMIDKSVKHAHVLDGFINTCAGDDELFPVTDIGRIVFSDENADGKKIVMSIEVTYEYSKGDSAWVMLQSLDKNSAEFYKDLDDQLQAIFNPFVEPVFINSKIPGAIGVFGSTVLSDSVLFIYPRDNP